MKKLNAAELVSKIVERPFTREEIPFPRVDENGQTLGMIALRLLEQTTQTQCRVRALRAVQAELGGDAAKFVGADSLVEDQVVLELLAVAIVDTEAPHAPLFKSAKELGDALYPCEVVQLYQAWNELQVRYMATEDDIKSEKQYTEHFGLLKEGLRSFPLVPTRFKHVADLLLCAAERVSSIYALRECPPETLQTHLESLWKKWGSDTPCFTGLQSNLSAEK